MGEIKSAWEIALERTREIPAAAAAELERERAERVGRALAERILNGVPLKEVLAELEEYRGEEAAPVTRTAAAHLLDGLEPEPPERFDTVAAAVARLLGPAARELEELAAWYRRAREEKVARIEAEGRALLRERGISGPAVAGINAAAREAWRASLQGLEEACRTRLADLKARLAG